MVQNVYWFSCKVPVTLVRVYGNLNSLDRFLKNTQITIFIKIRPVGAELFPCGRTDGGRTDGQTDERKDGRTERRTEGRTDGKTDGRTDGQTDGDGRKDGQTEGRTEGRTDGRKDGWTDGRKDGRKDGRTDRHEATPNFRFLAYKFDRNM